MVQDGSSAGAATAGTHNSRRRAVAAGCGLYAYGNDSICVLNHNWVLVNTALFTKHRISVH